MQKNYFIAGDWGTSNLRLYLCEASDSGTIDLVETRFGPGISEINGDFEDRFFNLAQDWLDQHGRIPVILSGMIGSNIGWKEAPYLACPVSVQQIADGRISFTARGIDFSILAGLRTTNPLGTPDVMRGEELQMLGWMLSNRERGPHNRLFALPGTHNKWTRVRNDQIETFLTAYTGELFGLLRKNSILITDDSAISFNQDVFMDGVRAVEQQDGIQLIHALFSTRSKQVLGEMASTDGLSYLSGLIAAADIHGALKLFAEPGDEGFKVTVIGESTLSQQYLLVLDHLGVHSSTCDPAEIAIAGFAAIYQNLYTN
ncbi:MAG: 2-dehydro-3-deoxygalactonokinase [Pseudomonadota bacterium]